MSKFLEGISMVWIIGCLIFWTVYYGTFSEGYIAYYNPLVYWKAIITTLTTPMTWIAVALYTLGTYLDKK